MKSSLKLKYNPQTTEFSATTAEGNDITQGLMIDQIEIKLDAYKIPTVVFTCKVFDSLEIELAEAEIEVREIKVRK
jgi:hypothetical protein